MKFGSITDGYGNPISGGGGGTFTTYWIPNYIFWEDTSVVAPLAQAPVFRVGSILYMFGGTNGTVSNKIYSAPYDATGTVPVFVDTGAVMPSAAMALRLALIDNTLYTFGNMNGSTPITAIWSAPLSAPTNWTTTGSSIPQRRDDSQLVVANGSIMMYKGYSGSGGYNDILYTSTSTPTSGWTNTALQGGSAWQCGFYYNSGKLVAYGGFQATTEIRVGTYGTGVSWPSLPNSVSTLPVTDNTPETFISDEVFYTGYNNGTGVNASIVGSESSSSWNIYSTALPGSVSYIYGCSWIGGDGRAYLISPTNRHIYRSARKKVYVPFNVQAIGPYSGLIGQLDDGTPSFVSSHVLMGNRPWLTNLVTAY